MKSRADRITELQAGVARADAALNTADAKWDKADAARDKAYDEQRKARRALADALAEGDA